MTISKEKLEKEFDEIIKYCEDNDDVIIITKDGKPDLVLMSNKTYKKQKASLELKERILEIEKEQLYGAKYYTLEELDSALKKLN